jgi:hypothetical protein
MSALAAKPVVPMSNSASTNCDLWAGIDLKVGSAWFHLDRMGKTLQPPDQLHILSLWKLPKCSSVAIGISILRPLGRTPICGAQCAGTHSMLLRRCAREEERIGCDRKRIGAPAIRPRHNTAQNALIANMRDDPNIPWLNSLAAV